MFNEYPYRNIEDLNLDFLQARVRNLEKIVEQFVALESVTFADPIQWNITRQYAKNVVVLDPDGDAFMSINPVPVGVYLNNSDYWLEIFNFIDYVKSFNSNLTFHIESNTNRATASYSIDDWLLWDDILYKVTASIAIDDLLVIGTNIVHFTVEDFCRAWSTYMVNTIAQYKHDTDADIVQYKNDIDASEVEYRNLLAGDIASTTASLQAQLDAAIAGATVDSEVINARIGADGVTYPTLGDAIRTQIGGLLPLKFARGGVVDTKRTTPISYTGTEETGYLSTSNTLVGSLPIHCKVTDIIPTVAGDIFSYTGKGEYSTVSWIFFDGDDIISTGQFNGTTQVLVPDGVNGIRFCSYEPDATPVTFDVKLIYATYRTDVDYELQNALKDGYYILNPDMEEGAFGTYGADVADSDSRRTSDYIPINSDDVLQITGDPIKCYGRVLLYDSTKTLLTATAISVGSPSAGGSNNTPLNTDIYVNGFGDTVAYMRFSLTPWTAHDLSAIRDARLRIKTKSQIDLEKNLANVLKILPRVTGVSIPTTSHGGYLNDKNLFDGASNVTLNCLNTEIIPTVPGDKYSYSGVSEYSVKGWIFFNGGKVVSSGSYRGTGVITVPDGVTHVRFSSYGNNVAPSLDVKLVEAAHYDVDVSKLNGKKIGLDGDSICWWNNDTRGYAKILKDAYGMVIENLAESGGTIVNNTYFNDDPTTPRHWISESVENLSTDNDFIIIEGGVNDAWLTRPLGSLSNNYVGPYDKSTFYGALEYIAMQLRTVFVSKKVGFIIIHKTFYSAFSSGTPTNGAYYDAVYEVMKKWGIPVLDLNTIVPPFGQLPNTDPTYAAIRNLYTTSGDGTHPTQLGYLLFYIPHIVSWLCSM